MNVLIALDSFKGSLSAEAGCEIAAKAILEQEPRATLEECPLSDGGEGFTHILTQSAKGMLKKSLVHGPLDGQVEAVWGVVEASDLSENARQALGVKGGESLAIIEMAQASGLPAVPDELRNPWKTTTYGTGELLAEAARESVDAILIGLGGSATNDMGIGALQALGLEVFREGQLLESPITPEGWQREIVYKSKLRGLPPIKIASDVTNPLTGDNGATAIFGPQKGLKPEDCETLDQLMGKQAKALCQLLEKPESLIEEPGSGAAGGIAFGLRVAYDAELLDGFQLVSKWLDLEVKMEKADWVITGEGKFDMTSLQGKGPGSMLKMAHKLRKPILILAGKVDPAVHEVLGKEYPLARAIAITPNSCPLAKALKDAKSFLYNEISTHLLTFKP